ncbi:heme anaerobic degradation radical SAM methyltransferase ChuW/HutW [Bosea sp. (in: a-proteobacteria)]|uniref:heme anaerobic degradation radical SAM methyltransferase ChuW/HutW n=1 Tax=Bosea sp. (in: a-proteobacteria) TaxID=1871050 RepID=UPI00261ED874|nr:heme anaerobic degradation radical SAM methyltransferase ChuW/HutW [Bosea sp. (in: a-proteobacteria)]MCO5091353.1 heme anaerobic degradation radical SAM methyltransferase ChuW/HutW [Bosea sp. (in: a-proteobacteria)]
MVGVADIGPYFARIGPNPLRDAFEARRAVMPARGGGPVEPDEVQGRWRSLLAQASERGKRLAYIHVPFCANHCLFCGFYRNAYVGAQASGYVDLVIEEIGREAGAAAIAGVPVHAVYLGGGTPSALSADELSRLLKAVRASLPLAPDCEITVEGRIIHFDPEKIDACLEAGANRFSIGVQSFDTQVRRRQGRRSTREEAIRFLADLRARDRAALVIDLIYGLPGQDPEIWRQDLDTAAALEPDGIDLYGLNLIPGTPLATAISAGKFPSIAELSDLGGLYAEGAAFLRRRNWRQLSNNHWGRTTRERNLYNLLIKEGADCLAYGSGAGGSLGGHGYMLTGDLERHAMAVRAGEKPIAMMTGRDGNAALRHAVTAAFEVGHLELERLERIAGRDLAPLLLPLLQQWQQAGLLVLDEGTADLTVAGRFWYGNLVSAFHDLLNGPPRPARAAA